MPRFTTGSWSVATPPGWVTRREPDCVTLEASPEIGALQISAGVKASLVTDTDLKEFASEHIDAGAVPREARAGSFVGFEISFSEDDFYCRQWYLRHHKLMLFLTYTCEERDRGREDKVLGQILASLVAEGHSSSTR